MHDESPNKSQIREKRYERFRAGFLDLLNKSQDSLGIFVAARPSELGDPSRFLVEFVIHHPSPRSVFAHPFCTTVSGRGVSGNISIILSNRLLIAGRNRCWRTPSLPI